MTGHHHRLVLLSPNCRSSRDNLELTCSYCAFEFIAISNVCALAGVVATHRKSLFGRPGVGTDRH